MMGKNDKPQTNAPPPSFVKFVTENSKVNNRFATVSKSIHICIKYENIKTCAKICAQCNEKEIFPTQSHRRQQHSIASIQLESNFLITI